MLKFFALRRLNYIDLIGCTAAARYVERGELTEAIITFIASIVLGVAVERKAFGPTARPIKGGKQ